MSRNKSMIATAEAYKPGTKNNDPNTLTTEVPEDEVWYVESVWYNGSQASNPVTVSGGVSRNPESNTGVPSGGLIWTQEIEMASSSSTVEGIGVYDDYIFAIEDYDDMIFALDRYSGERLWRTETEYTNSNIQGLTYHNAENLVMSGADEYFMAFDIETGDEIWRYQASADIQSQPQVADNSVLFGDQDGYIYSLDVSNGSENWSKSTGGTVNGDTAVYDGKFYCDSSGHLYIYDIESGSENDESTTSGDCDVMAVDETNGVLYIVDRDDAYLEYFDLSDLSSKDRNITGINDITVQDGVGIAVHGDGLTAYEHKDLNELWMTEFGDLTVGSDASEMDLYSHNGYVVGRHPGGFVGVSVSTGEQIYQEEFEFDAQTGYAVDKDSFVDNYQAHINHFSISPVDIAAAGRSAVDDDPSFKGVLEIGEYAYGGDVITAGVHIPRDDMEFGIGVRKIT